ncbi:TRI47 protein, partial [Polypterus senegalus]
MLFFLVCSSSSSSEELSEDEDEEPTSSRFFYSIFPIQQRLMMAEAQLFVSQDEFTCSVCLDNLTDPVTIPCGPSFCLKCHTDCYDQSQLFSCPQCREKFKKKGLSSPPSQNYAGPGDVECDACTEKKFRAVKSCLTCPASYCQTHFEIAAWKDHKLVDPDGNLKEKLCEKHQKSLEIFCETDDACICTMCGVTEHNGHKMVKLEMEREDKEHYLLFNVSFLKSRPLFSPDSDFSSRCVLPADGDSLSFTVNAGLTAVDQRKELSAHEAPVFALQPPERQSRDDFLKYFCPLTLDINMVNGDLCLFEGNKKVTRVWKETEYPDHPDRFEYWCQVLCREALTGTC